MAGAVAMTRAVRLLAIMGSGETTPTMVKVHRQLFERLGPGDSTCRVAGHPIWVPD